MQNNHITALTKNFNFQAKSEKKLSLELLLQTDRSNKQDKKTERICNGVSVMCYFLKLFLKNF